MSEKTPEVATLEKDLEQVDAQFEKEGLTTEIQITLDFMLGKRPAGGPYELSIQDDARFKTFNEYKLGMKLIEHPADEHDEKEYPNGRVIFEGGVSPSKIDKYIELEKRRDEILILLNQARHNSQIMGSLEG